MELARLLEDSGDYRQAAAIYEQHVLEQDAHNSQAWMRLVGVYLKAGDKVSALEVSKNYSESTGSPFLMPSLLIEHKLYDEAKAILSLMLKDPGVSQDIYFYLAIAAYDGEKNILAALEWLSHISEDNRFYGRSLHLRAQLLMEQKKYAESLKAIENARKFLPDEFALPLMQAHILNQQKKFNESLNVIDEALHIWPDSSELRYSRGMILDLSGSKEEAMKIMESLAEDLPDYYQALNYIGYSLAEQNKDLPRALELLHKADSLAPDTAYILDSLAWAQFKSGQIEEAWSTIQRAVLFEDGQDPVIWEHYGDIALKQGLLPEARSAYLKALETGHEYEERIRKKLERIP